MESTQTSVFVDTNVLFSALHSPTGTPARLIDLSVDGRFQIIVSQRILTELIRTTEAKLPLELANLSNMLMGAALRVVSNPPRDAVDALLNKVNPQDAPILAAALAAQADYLVTGDRIFLREARKAQIAIAVLSPREFLNHLESTA